MSKITIAVLLLLLCVSCEQVLGEQVSRPKGEKFAKGKGPDSLDVNTEYAVLVRGPAAYACTFLVEGGQAFVLYRRESGQWQAKASCNNAAGGDGNRGRFPADGADWMITGWYRTHDRAWRQCNFKDWRKDGDGEALLCETGGGWMRLVCPQGQCTKP